MAAYYPARDGHPSMFALDTVATVETVLIVFATSRHANDPELPGNAPAKTRRVEACGRRRVIRCYRRNAIRAG